MEPSWVVPVSENLTQAAESRFYRKPPAASFEPGLAQAVENVVDPSRVRIKSSQGGSDKGEIWIECPKIGERGLRFVDPPELRAELHALGVRLQVAYG